jgi:hypothetical protein
LYGIIGEDDSDAATLKVLVHRLADNWSLTVRAKGYDGGAQMLRKGAGQLRLFAGLGFMRFVVSYDSDGHDPEARRKEVMEKVVIPAGLQNNCCVLIPIQEIEAWILADIQAVNKVFSSWKPDPIPNSPESIESPKEFLERLSRNTKKKPIYHHATHNQIVAKHLCLDTIRRRCPSFMPLVRFVTEH